MRKFIITLLALTSAAIPVIHTEAQTDLYVRGSGKLFPVALPQLCGDPAGGTVNDIPRIIARDLDLSGYFEVIKPSAYIEAPGKCNDGIAYSDWSVIGSEGLVKGVVENVDGRMRIKLYLHDVQKQQVVLGKEYAGDQTQISRIAHRFANEIMKFFTGEYGVFGTQIGFSSRVGRFKELFVMDMDGSNIRQLTNERGLALSSAWDPSGNKLVYTSYRNRVPDLFLYDLISRNSRQITQGPDMEIGTHFAPSGDKIITSRTEGGGSSIITMNLSGQVLQRLTTGGRVIDVSPVYSPDGSSVVFCSNRGGGPQIYRMGADGSNPRRVSFVNSSYCTSPAWSPKGDKIAFVCRADGNFQMFISDPDGGNALQLTSGGSNEDPEFSPDGRYLVFATTNYGGNFSLAIMRSDGSSMKQLTTSRSGDFEPTWGPMPLDTPARGADSEPAPAKFSE